MQKELIDKIFLDLHAVREESERLLRAEQDRDISAVRAELSDLGDRLNALEAKRDEIIKLVNTVQSELLKAVNVTFSAMIKFETERREALDTRLDLMTGEKVRKSNRRKTSMNRALKPHPYAGPDGVGQACDICYRLADDPIHAVTVPS